MAVTPKASVHTEFVSHLTSLQAQAAAEAAVLDGGQRPHSAPPSSGWSGDPSDLVGMSEAFDRAAIGQNYDQVILNSNDPGTVGDCIALKLQSDYIACRETAFRAAAASSVRSAIHAAARRRGHGHGGGVLANGVMRYVQDMVRQGGSS